MKTNLILYSSYCTQHSKDGRKGDWVLFDKEKQQLEIFPKEWDEKMIFNILDFAKKYELDAFNKGIEYGKNLNPTTIKALESVIRQLKEENKKLLIENERIGGKLDQLLTFNKN